MRKALHDEIMNLPCNYTRSCFSDEAQLLAYKEGHRDARHAAAELAITADDLTAKLKAAYASIGQLQVLVAERDAMLAKRPCQNSRCNELNAARALLREVLDSHNSAQASVASQKGEYCRDDIERGERIRAYLYECDKPGEPDAS